VACKLKFEPRPRNSRSGCVGGSGFRVCPSQSGFRGAVVHSQLDGDSRGGADTTEDREAETSSSESDEDNSKVCNL
jgi:hypothetical protein